MPTRRSKFIQGHYYHLYNRGINREPIFFSTRNYLHCLKLMQDYTKRFQVTVVAYCLMPNHYHFLLRQDGIAPISKFMNVLFNAYVQALNFERKRVGPLFQGRFKDKTILDGTYLKHLCRYIHANPIAAGIVSELEAWPFSNYLEWVDQRNGTLWDKEIRDTFFGSGRAYAEFVSGWAKDDLAKYGF